MRAREATGSYWLGRFGGLNRQASARETGMGGIGERPFIGYDTLES
jgi:hypothetical protein